MRLAPRVALGAPHLGGLRRRQGRLDEAQALFARAEFHPSAIVGRARIQMSGGNPVAGWAAIRSLLQRLRKDGRRVRADVLLPAVLIGPAVGDVDAARLLAMEMRQTTELTGIGSLMAAAVVAGAALALPDAAIPC